MYTQDLRTGTDYEYEKNLDALMQKGYGKKTIKVKYAPDTEELADMGTVYIGYIYIKVQNAPLFLNMA